MKRTLGTLAALALAVRAALAAAPAELNVVAFDGETPLAAAIVEVDGDAIGATNADGTAQLQLMPGKRTIVLRRDGAELLRYEIEVAEGENAELIATLRAGAEPSVQLESSLGARESRSAAAPAAAADAGPPGTLRGRIVSSENGAPIANARVFVSGTPLDLRTDADGRFEASLPPGSYAISVVAADYAAQTLEGLAVASEQATVRDVELTPAGLELPEFVVLEPYVQGSLASFVEEKRESFAVAEVLGIEQISRAGDSDVAGALRRVTGLTLVDGKYVYVRGLGERYSSVLLNGAQIPSPDPTRRVVPLDLFPVEILQGLVIQKSFSAEMPGEFGGGTIELRTRSIPEEFFFRLSLGGSYVDGTTGDDGLRYSGGTRDWTGFDDGTRDLPDSVASAIDRFGQVIEQTPFNPEGLTPAEVQQLGRDASRGWDLYESALGPGLTGAASIGDRFTIGDWTFGYLGSARLAHAWDSQEEVRRTFSPSNAGLSEAGVLDRRKTERNVDLSGYLSLGVEYGTDHKLTLNNVLVRQTVDEARVDEGYRESPDQVSRFFKLEWEENELLSQQVLGEHVFPEFWNVGIDWQYTKSAAERYAPYAREYRYERVGEGSDARFRFAPGAGSNQLNFSDLTDDLDNWSVDISLPIVLRDDLTLTMMSGVNDVKRKRESSIRRFEYRATGGSAIINDPDIVFLPLERILGFGNIRPGGFFLDEVTRSSDAYVADQTIDAEYLTADLLWTDVLRVTAGMRRETLDQSVSTFSITNPDQVEGESVFEREDSLPSAGLTWFINEDSQFRAVFAETVSRPDFRELSLAPFTDPLLDVESLGNPDLEPTAIKNYDLRYEYYFSATETTSIGVFYKEFESPIERVILPATGQLVGYANAESATLTGVEFDYYRSLDGVQSLPLLGTALRAIGLGSVSWEQFFLGGNYAYIESDIELDALQAEIQTNLDRPLQGQSPWVGNLQFGWQPVDGESEATLVFNRFGRRISQVGTEGAPDIYEEPVSQLDLVLARRLSDAWRLRVRLRNLLDPEVRFTQGDRVTREYRRGREISVSVEWRPGG